MTWRSCGTTAEPDLLLLPRALVPQLADGATHGHSTLSAVAVPSPLDELVAATAASAHSENPAIPLQCGLPGPHHLVSQTAPPPAPPDAVPTPLFDIVGAALNHHCDAALGRCGITPRPHHGLQQPPAVEATALGVAGRATTTLSTLPPCAGSGSVLRPRLEPGSSRDGEFTRPTPGTTTEPDRVLHLRALALHFAEVATPPPPTQQAIACPAVIRAHPALAAFPARCNHLNADLLCQSGHRYLPAHLRWPCRLTASQSTTEASGPRSHVRVAGQPRNGVA